MNKYFNPDSLLEQFLCSAIAFNSTTDMKATYHELGDKLIWDAAKTNQLESIIAYKLIENLGGNNIPRYWTNSYKAVHEKILAYLKELDRISVILASHGISLVALKNGGIARALYRVPGCVPMGDLDTLVKRSQFKQAHKVLNDSGYTISAPNRLEKADIDYGYRTGGSEYKTILPGGRSLWFELQWRPVAGRWLRPDQEPSAEELIERSIGVTGSSVRILSPEDNLIHVSLHTAKHSYVRAPGLRLHLDVDRIVNCQRIDWDIFLKRVRSLQIKVPVYFSLLIPRTIFGTPIPDEIMKSLRPSGWKEALIRSWLFKAGPFNPHGSKFGKIQYVLFNGLLYDDLSGLVRGIIPDPNWIKERYEIENNLVLPLYYVKRLLDLACKRMPT